MNTLGRNQRGQALVEFSLVALLLLVLVFGIAEFGLFISDRLALQQAAREGARTAAIGETTSAITQRVLSSAPGITLVSSNVTLQKRLSGVGSWVALGDDSGHNNAVFGDYVRVTVTYNHGWVTGLLWSSPTQLTAAMIARRE